MNIRWIFLISFVFLVQVSNAQEDDLLTLDVQKIISLPNKFDYNQEIVSASKKSERLFDAPLSASVLTKEEIIASGATSIAEALRLVPGIIVRQVTNGSYNIQIRGMDWLPRNSDILAGQNQLTLVMIDDRPVYSYSIGVTFWNTLPIQLADIERVEVIRGCAASLFGANAVTGVVNIITAKPKREGVYSTGNVQLGSFNATVADMAVGYQFKKKFHIIASAHKTYKERTTNQFFNLDEDRYQNIEDIDILSGIGTYLNGEIPAGYRNPEVALDKMGGNLIGTYQFDNQGYINFKLGYNNVENMETFYNGGARTPLAQFTSEDYYFDMNIDTKGIKGKISYLHQNQDFAVGLYEPYEATLWDTYLSYEWNLNNFIRITPSISYRLAHYEHDEGGFSIFSLEQANKEILQNWESTTNLSPEEILAQAVSETFYPPVAIFDKRINSYLANPSFSLRADAHFWDKKLRLVGAFRLDQFPNLNHQIYPSYQFSSTCSFSKNHLIRTRVAKSYASNYLINTQVSLIKNANIYTGDNVYIGFGKVSGNPNLKPIEQQMIEIGYRRKLKEKITIDIEAFYGILKNQRMFIGNLARLRMIKDLPTFEMEASYENLPMKAIQTGITFSINYYTKRLSIKPFLTWQQTQIKDHSISFITPEFAILNSQLFGTEHYLDTKDIRNRATPNWYGGLNINLKPMSKWDIGLHTYFMSKQEYKQGNKSYYLNYKIIGNLRLGYHLSPQATLFLSVRDMSNTKQAEYYYTDPIQTSYWVGVNFNLK